jgi:signal peptide peptidase SppA
MTPTFPEAILTQPLCMFEPSLPAFVQRFERIGARMTATAPMALSISDFVNQRQPMTMRDGVAIIHVNDVLAQGLTNIDKMFGMTDYGDVSAEVAAAAADASVKAIVLQISSPGGSVVGAPEAAQAVANAASVKPVVASIGDIGASAAYYLAAASSAIFAQGSGLVGSIGTRLQFMDYAGMLAANGVTPHIITPKASDLKAAANNVRTPTVEESAWLQSHVEAFNAAFTGWVAKHRPKGTAAEMRGQVFTGNEAAQNGLADYVGNLGDAIAGALALADFAGR